MYRWHVKLLLNNGVTVKGVFDSTHRYLNDAIAELFNSGFNFRMMSAYRNGSRFISIGFRSDDVSAFWLSREPFNDKE